MRKGYTYRDRKDDEYYKRIKAFESPDFIDDAKGLRRLLENHPKAYSVEAVEINGATSTRRVYAPDIQTKLGTMAKSYNLSEEIILHFLVHGSSVINPKPILPSVDVERGILIIEAPLDVRMQDLIDQWPMVEMAQQGVSTYKSRSRSRVLAELDLAIWNARELSMKFREIKERLRAGTLPGLENKVRDYEENYIRNRHHRYKKHHSSDS